MSMGRSTESYNGGSFSYNGGAYGGSSYHDTHESGQYQMKQHKGSKSRMQDPEMKRRKRVASYKVFTVEGKVKASVRNSLRWIKNKYVDLRYGWW